MSSCGAILKQDATWNGQLSLKWQNFSVVKKEKTLCVHQIRDTSFDEFVLFSFIYSSFQNSFFRFRSLFSFLCFCVLCGDRHKNLCWIYIHSPELGHQNVWLYAKNTNITFSKWQYDMLFHLVLLLSIFSLVFGVTQNSTVCRRSFFIFFFLFFCSLARRWTFLLTFLLLANKIVNNCAMNMIASHFSFPARSAPATQFYQCRGWLQFQTYEFEYIIHI